MNIKIFIVGISVVPFMSLLFLSIVVLFMYQEIFLFHLDFDKYLKTIDNPFLSVEKKLDKTYKKYENQLKDLQLLNSKNLLTKNEKEDLYKLKNKIRKLEKWKEGI